MSCRLARAMLKMARVLEERGSSPSRSEHPSTVAGLHTAAGSASTVTARPSTSAHSRARTDASMKWKSIGSVTRTHLRVLRV